MSLPFIERVLEKKISFNFSGCFTSETCPYKPFILAQNTSLQKRSERQISQFFTFSTFWLRTDKRLGGKILKGSLKDSRQGAWVACSGKPNALGVENDILTKIFEKLGERKG